MKNIRKRVCDKTGSSSLLIRQKKSDFWIKDKIPIIDS